MRQEAIGLVLAAALIGGLFFAVNHRAERMPATAAGRPAVDAAAIQAAASAIKPGFVGLKRVGAWEVACAPTPVIVGGRQAPAPEQSGPAKSPPLPLSLGENKPATSPSDLPPAAGTEGNSQPPAATAPEEKISLGRCRATQAFRRKEASKGEVALAVNFRIVGAAPGRLGLFVRLPGGKGRQGESVQLRLDKGGFSLRVASCGNGGCMAVAVLGADVERDLLAAKGAELLIPPDAGGKGSAIRLAFVGLPAALAAIRRAQS